MYCRLKSFVFRESAVLDLTVEVTISDRGIPRVEAVGVRGCDWVKSVKKIRAAFGNVGIPFPNKKITINFAPEGVVKEVEFMDLPIVMGILFAQKYQCFESEDFFYGSLESSGKLIPVVHTLFLEESWLCDRKGRIFLPRGSWFVDGGSNPVRFQEIYSLEEARSFVEEEKELSPAKCHFLSPFAQLSRFGLRGRGFENVLGNALAKRALTISLAGMHNILLLGPSGTGKSLLASQCAGLFPLRGREVLIERARAAILCGVSTGDLYRTPYRAPHISAKESEIIGSSHFPGEVTLAHGGILFLDEMHLYPAKVLNALKTIVDRKRVDFNKDGFPVSYPANFLLIGAANNCMCGLLGSEEKQCRCTGADINLYNSRMTPALLERFDLVVHVVGSPQAAVRGDAEDAAGVSSAIEQACERQIKRQKLTGVFSNSHMSPEKIGSVCVLEKEGEELLAMAAYKFNLSTRAVQRIKLVSRTVADMEGADKIGASHIAEALQYRVKNDKP